MRKTLFAVAFAMNMLAFIFTVHLLQHGAMEGNPVMSNLFKMGVAYALAVSLTTWLLLYLALIYIPDLYGDKWKNASKHAIIVLSILIFIDFMNDLMWVIKWR